MQDDVDTYGRGEQSRAHALADSTTVNICGPGQPCVRMTVYASSFHPRFLRSKNIMIANRDEKKIVKIILD